MSKSNEFTHEIYMTAEEMCSTYPLAKVIKPDLTYEVYKKGIDDAKDISNYKQHVALDNNGKPVAMICVQDVLLMRNIPYRSCRATDHTCIPGNIKAMSFLEACIIKHYKNLGYGNIDVKSSKKNPEAIAFLEEAGFKSESFTWRLDVARDKQINFKPRDPVKQQILQRSKYQVCTTAEQMYKSTFEIAKVAFGKSKALSGKPNGELKFDNYKTIIDCIVNTSNYKQHILLDDNKPFAMVCVQDVFVIKNLPFKSCEVDNVACLPEYESVGTKFLMDIIRKDCKEQGYASMYVRSEKNNDKATAYYEKCGFERKGVAWRVRLDAESDKIMAKL